MLPPGHLASGYILACLLHRVGLCDGFMFCAVIIFSVIPDVDYLIRRSHRDFFTHTPIFWLCSTLIFWLCFLTPPIIWQQWMVILIASILHLLMDTISWGVMLLYPFSKKKYGLKILRTPENLENIPQIYFFNSYFLNIKLVLFEELLIIIAILLHILYNPKLSCTLFIAKIYYTFIGHISSVIEYLLPLTIDSVIALEIIFFAVFLIYWKKFDKNRKRFLEDIDKDKLTTLVNISLTTAVSMASLAGIILSLLFGFVISISTSSGFDSQFIGVMTWIITICFVSTSSFIVAFMAYHMSEYMGKTKNGEDIINAFRVGTFFYILGLLFFVLTITLLMLEVISYFDVGTPFISGIVLVHAIIVIAILRFVLKPVLQILMRQPVPIDASPSSIYESLGADHPDPNTPRREYQEEDDSENNKRC